MPNLYQSAVFHALRRPQAIAIDNDKVALSFGKFTALACAHAARLASLGVSSGERVCVLMNTSIDYVALYYATAVGGCIIVPVNVRLSPAEVAWQFDDAEPALVLFDEACEALAREAHSAAGSKSRIRVMAIDEFIAIPSDAGARFEPGRLRHGGVRDDDVSVVIYTSGTTSRPKGAMLTHGNLLWNAINYQIELGIDERCSSILATPLFHIGGLGVLNGPILNAGGRLSIMPRFDPEQAIDMLRSAQPSHLFLLSAMWVAVTALPEFAKLRFPDVRYVQTAASPLAEHQQAMIREVFPNAEFGWGFGMTETCVTTVKNRYTAEILSHPGSIGYVWRHLETRLVDEDGGVVSSGGAGSGEFQVRGPTVFAGYWRNLEATIESFTADGWLRTGDLLRLDDDGFAYFLGRTKDMIKSGGENVSALEVEQCLLENRSIREAAVYGVPSDRWGEEVRAAVVVVPGQELDLAALTAFCRSRIAGFKVPKRIDVVAELPKSASGKIQKFRLMEIEP